MSDVNHEKRTIDAEFEVVELETIPDAPVNGLYQQIKQNIAKFAIISLVVIIALLLLIFAFYLFIAFAVIALVLRLFGIGKFSGVRVNTVRFRR